MYKDEIILKATIEISPNYVYDFRIGTMGPTLYVEAPTDISSSIVRKDIPAEFEGYRTIVLRKKRRRVIEEW